MFANRRQNIIWIPFLILSLGYAVFSSPDKREYSTEGEDTGDEYSWDYLTFAIQWPISFCLYTERYENLPCRLPENTEIIWTIHGCWPSYSDANEGPSYCNQSWPFDWNRIKHLEKEFNIFWPNLHFSNHRNRHPFWAHEWVKHGTCAASLPSLSGELKYFLTSLELRRRFNFRDILTAGRITASSSVSYTYDVILRTLEDGLGSLPRIVCFEMDDFSQYFQAIELCLDTSLQLFDCPSNLNTCSEKKAIYLPSMEVRTDD